MLHVERILHVLRGATWILAPVMLIVLVTISYRDAPENGFHLDDSHNIYRYPPVMMTELTVDNVIDAGRKAYLSARPLPSMTFAIDWWRGGGSARPFQWTNLFIHASVAVSVFALLFVLLKRLSYPRWTVLVAALTGAAIWACHPIQVQGVTYIVQRMASMAALFTVLTVLSYVLARSQQGWRRATLFVLAGICWLYGIASKEIAAIAPFLVLLAEYGVVRHDQPLIRGNVDRFLIAVPAIVIVIILVDFLSGVGPLSAAFLPGYEYRDFTLTQRLLTQPRVIGFHMFQILWPIPGQFSLEHDFSLSTSLLTPNSTLVALLCVAAWCGIGVWAIFQRRIRIVGFFLLWVPGALIIESTVVPLEMVFEHRMYLPSVGLAGGAALCVVWLLRRLPRLVPVTMSACAIVIVLLMVSTAQQVPVWRDHLSLAQHTVKTAPQNPRAWSQLARALKQKGYGWDRIMPPMMRALELDPLDRVGLHLRATMLIEQRRLGEAESTVELLAGFGEFDHSIISTIGNLRFEQGDFPAAIEQYERAVNLNPFEPGFQYNLALAYEYAGRCHDAELAWKKYLQDQSVEQQRTMVRERLKRNFDSEGGRCYEIK